MLAQVGEELFYFTDVGPVCAVVDSVDVESVDSAVPPPCKAFPLHVLPSSVPSLQEGDNRSAGPARRRERSERGDETKKVDSLSLKPIPEPPPRRMPHRNSWFLQLQFIRCQPALNHSLSDVLSFSLFHHSKAFHL